MFSTKIHRQSAHNKLTINFNSLESHSHDFETLDVGPETGSRTFKVYIFRYKIYLSSAHCIINANYGRRWQERLSWSPMATYYCVVQNYQRFRARMSSEKNTEQAFISIHVFIWSYQLSCQFKCLTNCQKKVWQLVSVGQDSCLLFNYHHQRGRRLVLT